MGRVFACGFDTIKRDNDKGPGLRAFVVTTGEYT